MLTQERLKELLDYNPDTGIFSYIKSRGNQMIPGDTAGYVHEGGYVVLIIDGKKYRAHRLAFLYMDGDCLDGNIDVDHINRIRNDNRWLNLRKASRVENRRNSKINKNNTSGFKGVRWRKRKNGGTWEASLKNCGNTFIIGCFKSKNDAALAVKALREKLHGEFCYHGD